MATYTAIYEIVPNAKFFSEESFLKEINPAINIINTLSESFGGCKPKTEIISKAPYKARVTISISAGQQKILAIYRLFDIIGDYIAYHMGDTYVEVHHSCI
jgi:hypothetical protein|nr:MAG TPA: hypothetical protein [Caudoviricetes sp.]